MLNDTYHSLREDLTDMAHSVVDSKLKNEVRTTIPGNIQAFDAETQLATVQIGIQRLNTNGKAFTPPPVIRCPVCVYGAAGGLVEVQINKGDECLIHFSMRCIDGWRQQGGVAPLVSVERFRHSDAFAVLAPRSMPNVVEGYDNSGIKIRSLDGTRYVWLQNDGTISCDNGNGNLTLLPNGNVDANGCTINTSGNVITASGTDLDQLRAIYNSHNHGGAGPTPTA